MNNQKLTAALLAVAEQAKSGTLPEPDFGICMNLTVELIGTYKGNESYEAVASVAHKFGFNVGYPIPRANHNPAPLWQGRQLELRLDFISKMITYLEIAELQQEAENAQENCTSETI